MVAEKAAARDPHQLLPPAIGAAELDLFRGVTTVPGHAAFPDLFDTCKGRLIPGEQADQQRS